MKNRLVKNQDMSHMARILKRVAITVIKKYFENHPTIKQIQESFQHQLILSIPYTRTEEVKKLLKEVNAKNASGFDKISPKLV